MIGTILWALVVGTVLGYLAKFLLPGKQNIPAWATISAGVVAALAAGLVADGLGVGDTAGIDWIRHALQVVFAMAAVWLTARMLSGRRAG